MILPAPRKKRRKNDGTTELVFDCPLCGSRLNMEVNLEKGVFKCWACQKSGSVPAEYRRPGTFSFPPGVAGGTPHAAPAHPATLHEWYPDAAMAEIRRRGFDPEWLYDMYGVRWTGEHLWWPAGRGGILRSIWPWDDPKTKAVAPRDLLGQHRLFPGAHVVVTEGDYKSAAIPLPWIGVGVMGTAITPQQALLLRAANPASVTVMLDGGYEDEAYWLGAALSPVRVLFVTLPKGKGPDDIERVDLHRLLLQALGGWKEING